MRRFLTSRRFSLFTRLGKPSGPLQPPDPFKYFQAPPRLTHKHGITIEDRYAWLENKDNPAVQRYIDAENAYTRSVIKGSMSTLQKKFASEILSNIEKEDPMPQTPPEYMDGYFYYMRNVPGLNFPLYCRRKGSMKAKEEVFLDQNRLLNRRSAHIGSWKLSCDQRVLGYCLDKTGEERYDLYLKNLSTSGFLENPITNVLSFEFGNDPRALVVFYTVMDEFQRPYRVYRHVVGQPRSNDQLIYQEDDPAFFLDFTRSKDKKYVFITSNSKTTSEVRAIPVVQSMTASPILVQPRVPSLEYYVDHYHGRFIIVTNAHNARNFKVVSAPVETPTIENWRDLVPEMSQARIRDIDVMKEHLVVWENHAGFSRLRICQFPTTLEAGQALPDISKQAKYVSLPELSTVVGGANSFESSQLRILCSSPLSLDIHYDYDLKTGTLRELAAAQIRGYDSNAYVCHRVEVASADGEMVPLTLVHHKNVTLTRNNPVFLLGYGAYGENMDTRFSFHRLSLLNRGWVIAFAHTRGGGEKGTRWYDSGKLLHKMNTFSDFLACGRYLVDHGYSQPALMTAESSSAGGLLVGAVANATGRSLFQAAIMRVPFVDVVGTMCQPHLPLTLHEYDEWGNPDDPQVYHYWTKYSPLHNIRNQEYPWMWVTGSLLDQRVQYFEPLKWVAKLRHHQTDPHAKVLLNMSSETGHFGDSGRYEQVQETAMEYSFLFHALSIQDKF